jgi:basic membrane protein A
VVLALALAGMVGCGGPAGLKVGLAYAVGGPGDHGFNDLALAGLNRAEKDLSGSVSSVRALTARPDEPAEDRFQRLSLLCQAGYNPVIAVGFTYAGGDPANGPLARAAKQCPDTDFAIIDDGTVHLPNVADLVFADEQGAFLMGVVAASRTLSGRVGFLGACPTPLILRFLAGYQAGARTVRPGIGVDVDYVSGDPTHCDFTDVDRARAAATRLYSAGSDIVFQVAGGAGIGVFQAAEAAGKWAIGVDGDQAQTVDPALRQVILTSMTKRVDNAVFDFIASVSQHRFTAGVRTYDLADHGIGYATSDGQVSDLAPTLADYRMKIASGQLVVPVTP